MDFKDFFAKIRGLFSGKNKSKEVQISSSEVISENLNLDSNVENINSGVVQNEANENIVNENQEIADNAVDVSNTNLTEEHKAKQEDDIEITNKTSRETGKKIIIPTQRQDGRKFIQISVEKLELNAIEREAETITAYYKLLAKDIAHYKDEKTDELVGSIEKKYKMIVMHSTELNNLISALNELFYEYLSNNLLNENVSKNKLEEGQKKICIVQEKLAKIISYDDLFNHEKTSQYKDNINKEADKGEFMKELEDLSKYLVGNINNKKDGINNNVNEIVALIKGEMGSRSNYAE